MLGDSTASENSHLSQHSQCWRLLGKDSELMRVTRNLGNLDEVGDAAASAALPVALPGNSAAAAGKTLLQYAAQNVACSRQRYD